MNSRKTSQKKSSVQSQPPTESPRPQKVDPKSKKPVSLGSTPNPILGVFVAIARKILFIDTARVAIFYLAFITFLSLIEKWFEFDSSYYLVQKHSVFNQYGVKIGWFWTLVVVGPFVYFCSKAHYRDRDMPYIDLCRLGVATFFWWIAVKFFHFFTASTSVCNLGVRLTREQCSAKKGVWTPGYDISGHCFLMLYSILIITEEAKAFRRYMQVTAQVEPEHREQHDILTRRIQIFFVAMLVLHAFWFKQLIISVIYYHFYVEEIVAALVAVFFWFITYRMAYPVGFLQSPINRGPR
ncbi:unnamed protein product [Caenorhabditis bovis]|uniref:Uncharacterized protein n=1 Tax=Caenorhabditis bovis TaxID=2654633 RepID=A0A8S1FDY2_9PELO|nr:unnamed protein product [Caenorhabditis bovis]